MKVVIIGAGIAALEAAAAIRARRQDAEIHLLSREPALPYRRPALTRMISQPLAEEQFLLHPAAYYQEQGWQLHPGVEAVAVNREPRTVRLNSGESLNYDKLLIAAGGRGVLPPIPGIQLPQVIALREKAQLDALRALLAGGIRNIAVIGGGLLGLEIADSLSRLKLNVAILESCPALLPRQLDKASAALVSRQLNSHPNITTRYGICLERILGDGKVEGAMLQNGERIPCELIVVSAGMKPNLELAAQAGLATSRGIIVNERMETSGADIYAAGDCAVFNNCVYGLWQPAREQGAVAGANIAGEPLTFNHNQYGARLNAFGVRMFSVGETGQPANEAQTVEAGDELKHSCRKLFFKNNVLTGGILLGDIAAAAQLEKAVAAGRTLEQCRQDGLI